MIQPTPKESVSLNRLGDIRDKHRAMFAGFHESEDRDVAEALTELIERRMADDPQAHLSLAARQRLEPSPEPAPAPATEKKGTCGHPALFTWHYTGYTRVPECLYCRAARLAPEPAEQLVGWIDPSDNALIARHGWNSGGVAVSDKAPGTWIPVYRRAALTKAGNRTDCYGAELGPISESDGAIYSSLNGGARQP